MSITFRAMVADEISRARSKGYICKNWHEAYALILEEVDEFWDEVKKKLTKRDRTNALKELAQIAALCQRVAEDLALVDDVDKQIDSNTRAKFNKLRSLNNE